MSVFNTSHTGHKHTEMIAFQSKQGLPNGHDSDEAIARRLAGMDDAQVETLPMDYCV